LNVPEAVGVPLIVIVLLAKLALNPAGRPDATPIPVAPVVANVTVGDNGRPIQTVGLEDGAETVLFGVIVIVPVAFTVPQPPVNGIV
jgi:hypothetical protein